MNNVTSSLWPRLFSLIFFSQFFLSLVFFSLGVGIAPSADKVTAIDLLSIKVISSKSVNVAKFNKTIDIAARQGAQWVKDPVAVTRKYNYWPGRTAVIFINGEGERPSKYKITIISEGFLDDSIRGQRDDMTLVQDRLSIWHLKSVKTSWRCWPERGHTHYSIIPCR